MSLPVVEKVAPLMKPSSDGMVSKESTWRTSTMALVILMGVTSFVIIGLTYHAGAVINSTLQETFVEDSGSERVGGLVSVSSNRTRNLTVDRNRFKTLYLHKNAKNKDVPRPMHKLLDFVVAGFPKCGTSNMLHRLHKNPQVYMGTHEKGGKERHELRHTETHYFEEFVNRYSMKNINKGTNLEGPGGKQLKQLVGFKSPEVLSSKNFLNNVVNFFPGVDMIVGVRHPVLHFQSNYNYKLKNADSSLKLPHTKHLIGDCDRDCHSGHNHHCTPTVPFREKGTHTQKRENTMCTMISTFHHALSRLALTPMEEEAEKKLLAASPYHKGSFHPEWTGRLLLVELGQITDTNHTRHDQYERSFEKFLGLEENSFSTERHQHKQTPKLINICDPEHREVRKHLSGIALESSKWITEYLLQSDRVVVTNRDHFKNLMKEWEVDPCASI
jgi:hypothetical protein